MHILISAEVNRQAIMEGYNYIGSKFRVIKNATKGKLNAAERKLLKKNNGLGPDSFNRINPPSN